MHCGDCRLSVCARWLTKMNSLGWTYSWNSVAITDVSAQHKSTSTSTWMIKLFASFIWSHTRARITRCYLCLGLRAAAEAEPLTHEIIVRAHTHTHTLAFPRRTHTGARNRTRARSQPPIHAHVRNIRIGFCVTNATCKQHWMCDDVHFAHIYSEKYTRE